MKLTSDHIDALNVTLNWFGGSINRLDLFVASVHVSLVRDLVDMGLMRKSMFGYEINNNGRTELNNRGITCFEDTRRY